MYKIFARIVHTPLNFINNLYPTKCVDPRIQKFYFKTPKFEEQYNKLERLASPSRKLSDLFWMNLDWAEIENKLGEINICDLGCGTGKYYLKLQEYSENKINQYVGFDIAEKPGWANFKANYANVRFAKYDGRNILDLIPANTSLIISQSAIEHFSEDLTIFKQLVDFAENATQNVFQIHLFPSKACLKLYPFHGIRQYTLRNISKITKLFPNAPEIKLYELGGENAYKAHTQFINNGFFKEISEIKTKSCMSKFVTML
ncbi:MAG: class I SAM-dependent methyltransferase [Chloroflexia bacterium]|nr:class I SAM-dependent methyltransferase [Chloroflexia bacterium]